MRVFYSLDCHSVGEVWFQGMYAMVNYLQSCAWIWLSLLTHTKAQIVYSHISYP